jgi:DNA-binding NtrC family response regulator
LRERPEDVAPLAQHFLGRTCAELGRDPLRLSQSQAESLKRHRWSGNIRELKNVIERAVIRSKSNRVRLDRALPRDSGNSRPIESGRDEQEGFVTDAEMRAHDKANMIAALRHASWQVWGSGGVAELPGLKPSTLTYRMKVLGVRREA